MKNISEMTVEEQKAIMTELAKLRANQDKAKNRAERMRIKNTLLLRKATEAGLKVTDAEIDAYIAKAAAAADK